MPPTKATSSSTRTIFSWCEYLSRTHESVSAWMFVPRVNTFMYDCTSRLVGRKMGNGAPSHTSKRTSTRRATSERRLRSTTGSSSRVRFSSGEKHQPRRWTCDRARAIASATMGR